MSQATEVELLYENRLQELLLTAVINFWGISSIVFWIVFVVTGISLSLSLPRSES